MTGTPTTAGPAISLRKVREQAPAIAGHYESARVSLEKNGMSGGRAAVYLVLDYSGSMREYYKDGSVQDLADRVLGLSAHLDDDGRVPVVFFSTDIDAVTDITLGNHHGRIDTIVAGLGHMGKTSYHLAMDAVIDHYLDSGSTAPALVVFQTDGGPISKHAAERYLCKAAKLPLFWQFIGFGNKRSSQFDFLRRLDELAPRQRGFLPRRTRPPHPPGLRAVRPAGSRIPALAGGCPRQGRRRLSHARPGHAASATRLRPIR